jgi:diaminopimelate epimerase
MQFYKYHALGNDYIVLDPTWLHEELTPSRIKTICHRNFGIGSDGILLGPDKSSECDFSLRIFNPDGSEAEKSGNGLRIFARYLWDQGLVKDAAFTVSTLGGPVRARVFEAGTQVEVDMGKVSFDSTLIPVEGPAREVINEAISINNTELVFCAATIGNPHCVIIEDDISAERVCELGPYLEIEPRFPNRTNVQFMKIIDRNNIQIEIWERGAGYTLASGSSASASAAVARKLGHCDADIIVHMPGGNLDITVADDYSISMIGPVTKVAEGNLADEVYSTVL